MIPAVKTRRGMTLAELMVAMAMVAVMIVMVVSFTMLMTEHTRTNGEELAFQQDFAAVKAAVEGWMDSNAGQTLICDEASVTAGESSTLKFNYGVLTAGELSLRTDSIGAVTFELFGDNGEYLLFCTVTRADSEDGGYTFCVNSRVGETVGGA